MAFRKLSHEATLRVLELGKKKYRPPEIVALKEKIDAETRAAEITASITGTVDTSKIYEIVRLKVELDNLYARWAEGKL